MSDYEVLTRLSNGKKRPHAIGAIVEIEDEAEAKRLVGLGALRPVAARDREADGSPIGTAQRSMAAATAGKGDLNFVTANAQMRHDLTAKSHKQLDKIIADEKIADIPAAGPKPSVAEKAEAIIAARGNAMLGSFDRRQLLDLAAASGFGDVAALELPEDAAETEIRAALMRVAAAKADHHG
ncbi:hypothetical protein MKP08_08300 [Erythrobacter sp. LQ02-29]|uniref:hypothetical protein n=1 Tax=Erythrobacter sp. LQ02-29 TaxID=2920384 RepID=UPI001F4EC422|nr:hypothetical protein [Erythrobacter sp. LQ02-29]MCP9222744.1 hypothetical protein [Erythrobacter sp. LQ02-29]